MPDDWKGTFPGKGVAEQVAQRLRVIIGYVEVHDRPSALKALRGWDGHLDFTGVPQEVMSETNLTLNSAMSHLKPNPPDSQLAIANLKKALDIWA